MATPADAHYFPHTPVISKDSKDDSYVHVGLNDNMFRPPPTPGTPFSTTTPYTISKLQSNQALSVTRKRLRRGTSQGSWAKAGSNNADDSDTNCDSVRAASPAPLANTQYALSGGFDTPTLAATARYSHEPWAEDGFRRTWGADLHSPLALHGDATEGPLARERNGHGRMTSSCYQDQLRAKGWGRYVSGLASTVAGKMWDFCRQSVFRGFHAGPAKGYDFARPTYLHQDRDSIIDDGDYANGAYDAAVLPQSGHFLSGRVFPGDFEQDNTGSQPRPSKRQHTETGSGWVVVHDHLNTTTIEDSPRLTARKVSNPLLTLGTPVASRASSRRSLVPISRRKSAYLSQIHPNRQAQLASDKSDVPSPFPPSYDRRASVASTRSLVVQNRNSPSRSLRPASVDNSPLTPEAKKYLYKKDREDKEADRSMRKMNKQLQELIRQGQAALGTTFQVNHDDVDEGFEDGDAEAWEDASLDVTYGSTTTAYR